MFGNKNKVSIEQFEYMKEQVEKHQTFKDKVNKKKESTAADYEQLEDSVRVTGISLEQLKTNSKKVIEHSNKNKKTIESIDSDFTECIQEAAKNLENLGSVADKAVKQYEKTRDLVEENKHFTTPSKRLSEISSAFEQKNDWILQCVEVLDKYNKQMSVSALNAAIEAGRLGESGKKFVEAAEDIRNSVLEYDKKLDAIREKVAESQESVASFKETTSMLVGMLKDNNVTVNKLMKDSYELSQDIEKCDTLSVETIKSCKEKLALVKDDEEDTIKIEERNIMSIDDIKAEIKAWEENTSEIKSTVDEIFEYTSKS